MTEQRITTQTVLPAAQRLHLADDPAGDWTALEVEEQMHYLRLALGDARAARRIEKREALDAAIKDLREAHVEELQRDAHAERQQDATRDS